MKKALAFILSVTMAFASLAGCSSGDTGSAGSAAGSQAAADAGSKGSGKLTVYGIYKAGDQTWFIDEGAAAKKAVEAAGGEFIYVDAKMSPEEYLKAIDNAIANNASGVVTCIPDQTMSQSVVDKLTQAKIPVIAADDALQDGSGKKLAPWVGIDAYAIGETNGKWLADYAKKNDLVSKSDVGLLIMTMDTVSSCVPRAEGEYDAFTKDCPDFAASRIFKADYDGTTDKGNTAAATVFTAHPEIKTWLVTGANEEGTIGACRALESAGLDKNACVVGLGAYLAKDEFKKSGGSPMKAATYFSSDSIGAGSVQVLLDTIAGKEVKQETAVSAEIVTPENYKEVMGAAAD
ncbi:arabinose ABC transporter substrate-binding protein [Caproiciproducens sp. R2]|uniref:arabinose ABC transporter substrate-binding protein n=1 Tax=Caproiciproducens sp. R2 TaxID=3435187 RepID=UPI00403334BC